MPRQTVTMACGCVKRVAVYGTQENRDATARETARDRCFDCRNADRLNAAAEKARATGLGELRGTVRQIAWAETIRAYQLAAVEVVMARTLATLADETGEHATEAAHLAEHLGYAREHLRSRQRAVFWIDHRDLQAADLLHVGLHAVIPPDDPNDTTHAERWARRRQWLGLKAPDIDA